MEDDDASPSRPRSRLLLLGTFVHCTRRSELGFMHGAAVAVDAHGTIAGIERARAGDGDGDGDDDVDAARAPAGPRLLARLGWSATDADVDVCAARPGQFFFPGFIDAHVHASQYPNVGVFGKSTLLDWLARYTFPLEASLRDLAKARRVFTACVARTLAHGTTTAAYFATRDAAATKLLADVCLAHGQRALVGRVCMDAPRLCPDYYRDESPRHAVAATLDVVAHVRRRDPAADLVAPVLTPRFAPACSSDLMRRLAALQREHDLAVQTHVSETADEVRLVADMFPDAASYADVYDAHGLLTSRTILAHAIHLTDAEARLVAARRAKVAHCPCSNSSLASGEARVRWLWDQGIDVGLGTDMSGGYSPSVLEAARHAVLVSRHVAMGLAAAGADADACHRAKLTVEEVLYLATRGGAHVVGLADKVGAFDVGKQWDAQLVDLGPAGDDDTGNVPLFGWETWDERMAKWLYTGDDRNTKKVWVKGRLVHARP